MAAAEAEAKEVLIAPEKHICKCAYIINVSSDKSFVVADLIDEGTKKRFKAKGKNTIQHRQEKLLKLSKIAEIMFRYLPKVTEAET